MMVDGMIGRPRMKGYRFTTSLLVVSALIVALALTGCTTKQNSDPFRDRNAHLRVGATIDFDFDDYVAAFQQKYPNITLELVTVDNKKRNELWDNQSYGQWLEEAKIDLLVTTETEFNQIANLNLLQPLDPLIHAHGFQVDDMHAPVIEHIRELGDGNKLYGLANSFAKMALFYNKALLNEAKIPHPESALTWAEINQFTRRAAGNGIFGLDVIHSVAYLGDIALWMGKEQGLDLIAEDGTFQIDLEKWEPIFRELVGLYEDRVVYPQLLSGRDLTSLSQNATTPLKFLEGKAAFAFGYSGMIPSLQQNGMDWGVVPLPDRSGLSWIDRVFAIPTVSSEPEAAWAFIRFSVSEEGIAQIKLDISETSVYPGIADKSGTASPDAFYGKQEEWYNPVPEDEMQSWFSSFVGNELAHVLVKRKEFDEALSNIKALEEIVRQAFKIE